MANEGTDRKQREVEALIALIMLLTPAEKDRILSLIAALTISDGDEARSALHQLAALVTDQPENGRVLRKALGSTLGELQERPYATKAASPR